MEKSTTSEILGEIPNLIVLALLIFALLFIATKYNWVRCSSVPQWCPIYCRISGHSQIAIIDGGVSDPGMGNAQLLLNQIQSDRINSIVVPFSADQISSGTLNNYQLVVLDHFQRITLNEAIALEQYVKQGGNLVWIGDAASSYVSTPADNQLALALNQTQPGYYQAYQKALQSINSSSFGPLGSFLGAQFVKSYHTSTPVTFTELDPSNPVVSGILNGYNFSTPYAVVTENPAVSDKVATLQTSVGSQVPAILIRRYVGTIVYVSFPLETSGSPTLTSNVIDYLVQC